MKYTREVIAAALAPAVGEERASELVAMALRELGLHTHELTAYEARALLNHLQHQGGVVGVSARIATARLPTLRESDAPRSESTQTISTSDVVALLAPSIGQERATELIEGACRKLRIAGDSLTRTQMEAILDDLALTPGVVGAVARFAKARALLK